MGQTWDETIKRIRELEDEVNAWRDRFPMMEYRRMDDIVAMKFDPKVPDSK